MTRVHMVYAMLKNDPLVITLWGSVFVVILADKNLHTKKTIIYVFSSAINNEEYFSVSLKILYLIGAFKRIYFLVTEVHTSCAPIPKHFAR